MSSSLFGLAVEKKRRRGPGIEGEMEGEEGRVRRRGGRGANTSEPKSVLGRLEAMLREAGEFPVVIEEAKLLQQEVVARRWSVKARKVLAGKPRVDQLEVRPAALVCYLSYPAVIHELHISNWSS